MNYHQGDVYLKRIEEISENARKIRENIVAYGEATGHTHFLKGSSILEENGAEYVLLKAEEILTHPEHPPINVQSGKYQIIIQKEYFPTGRKEVLD